MERYSLGKACRCFSIVLMSPRATGPVSTLPALLVVCKLADVPLKSGSNACQAASSLPVQRLINFWARASTVTA